jgi:formyl-CoA transferase
VDEDRIEKLLEAWTSGLTPAAVFARLQPAVAAAPVLSIPELHADPQIRHRGYWHPLEHPVYRSVPYSGLAHTLSRTPGSIRRSAPCLGEHSEQIPGEFAGLDPDDIAALVAAEIVEITG